MAKPTLLQSLLLVLAFAVPLHATGRTPDFKINEVMTRWRAEVGDDGRADLPWGFWANRDQYEQRKTSRWGCIKALDEYRHWMSQDAGAPDTGALGISTRQFIQTLSTRQFSIWMYFQRINWQDLLELRGAYAELLAEAIFDKENAEMGVNYVDRGENCYGKNGAWSSWYVSDLNDQMKELNTYLRIISDRLESLQSYWSRTSGYEHGPGASAPVRHPRASEDMIADRAHKKAEMYQQDQQEQQRQEQERQQRQQRQEQDRRELAQRQRWIESDPLFAL